MALWSFSRSWDRDNHSCGSLSLEVKNFCFYDFFNRTQFTEFPGFPIFANSTLFSRACFVVLPASSEAGIGFIRSRTLDLYLTEHINIHFWLQLFILQPFKLYHFSKFSKLVPDELVRSLLFACKQVIVNLCRCYLSHSSNCVVCSHYDAIFPPMVATAKT